LNIPPDHPAREMQDTIFVQSPAGPDVKSGMVLRTQTSPVQIRSMLSRPLPLYVVSPGRCYRHDPIQSFVDAMFGVGLRTRFRPDYFPFTEPSGDVSMECHICRGASAKP